MMHMISIIKTSDFNVKLKATIHSSGRLGFTADTAVNLNLSDDTFVKFAKDNENENELFMIFVAEKDEDTFKVVNLASIITCLLLPCSNPSAMTSKNTISCLIWYVCQIMMKL